MPHKNPLARERVFNLPGNGVSVETTMEDFFGALMQDNPTREECREMISQMLQQYVNSKDKKYKYIMGYVGEVV